MSVETITTIISAAGLLVSFATAFGWMINRTDKQSAETRRDLGERITGVERDLGERITGLGRELGERITGVERELVEVKVAVARIEGPPRRLLTAR